MIISSAETGDYEFDLLNLKVNGSLALVNKKLSGQGSSTSTTPAGNKPKTLSFAGQMPMEKKSELKHMVSVAEALQENGDRAVFTISDDIADIYNIRQVIFSDSLKITEDSNTRSWSVSGSFEEYKSVAEKKESRLQQNEISAQKATGKQVTGKDVSNNATLSKFEMARKTMNEAFK